MTASEFVREWDLLYSTYGEIGNYNSYLNWRSFILGEAAITDPLGSAASDYEHGFMSYYAYLRLYGWTVNQDPNTYVADKYNIGGPPSGKYLLTTTVTPVTKGNGVALDPPGGVYDPGATVKITAVPAQGYAFSSRSGDASGTANPVTVTMDKDKTVVANFTATGSGGGGGIDVGSLIGPLVMVMMLGMVVPMMTGIFRRRPERVEGR